MTNIESGINIPKSISDRLNALEKGDNLMGPILERIADIFPDASEEIVQMLLSQINEICSNDEGMNEKGWDFMKTLEKVLESKNTITV